MIASNGHKGRRVPIRLFVAVEDLAGPASLALLTLVLVLQIFGRWLGFGVWLTWTDEAARALFVASVFLSLPLAAKRGALIHIRLSSRPRPRLERLARFLWRATALALAGLSFKYVLDLWPVPQRTPILGLNQNALYLVVPAGFLLVFLRGLLESLGLLDPPGARPEAGK